MIETVGGADITPDGLYRYSLVRMWKFTLPTLLAVMLNPSTADADTNDATIRKLIKIADAQGFGTLVVMNLFSLRSTDPAALWTAADPVGADTTPRLFYAMDHARAVLLAWGGSLTGNPTFEARQRAVIGMARGFASKCRMLDMNKDGTPKHPLYCPDASPLQPFPFPRIAPCAA